MSRKKILVVGDVFLDRYLDGPVFRVSPEAPVPVVSCPAGPDDRPGGAAHVACAAAALGGKAGVVGVAGYDLEARRLADLIQAGGAWNSLVPTPDRPTAVKLRVSAAGHHLARADTERTGAVHPDTRRAVWNEAAPLLAGEAGLLVLSDYAKGVLGPTWVNDVCRMARLNGVPVVAAIKDPDLLPALYDALAVVMNWAEACRVVAKFQDQYDRSEVGDYADGGGPQPATDMVQCLAEAVPGAAHLVITRGRHGYVWFDRAARKATPVAGCKVECRDVTGAGDVFLAGLAVGLAEEQPFAAALKLANAAAAAAVTKFGTTPVPRDEANEVLDGGLARTGKVLDADAAAAFADRHRRAGRRVVLTNGCFDVLHRGHVELFRQAKAQGDVLVVAVNDDASVRRLKGGDRPAVALADRLALLAELGVVDAVVAFGEDTPERMVRQLKPDVLVKGDEYRGKRVAGADYVAAHGGRVVFVPMLPGFSSTFILEGRPNEPAGIPAS